MTMKLNNKEKKNLFLISGEQDYIILSTIYRILGQQHQRNSQGCCKEEQLIENLLDVSLVHMIPVLIIGLFVNLFSLHHNPISRHRQDQMVLAVKMIFKIISIRPMKNWTPQV